MSLSALQRKMGVKDDGSLGKQTFDAACKYFGKTKIQMVHFFAQCAHESGDFKFYSENLNYTAQGLLKVFPKYFKTMAQAQQYAHKREAIANLVYANRMGNGDEASGDGFKHRGFGAIQLTGKYMQEKFADSGFPDVRKNPELIATQYAMDSAKFFFDEVGIWDLCTDFSDDTITKVRKKVNGGVNGLADCIHKTKRYSQW